MKIITYNINGIRAALKKDFWKWLKNTDADIVCLQETKIDETSVDKELFAVLGYESHWFSAQKKGYSGVAILTKIKPLHIEKGTQMIQSDEEGRAIRADFEVNGLNFSVLNVYIPSGSSGEARQTYKYQWLDQFYDYFQRLRQQIPNLIICGDYNICHKAIDIHNPKANKNSSGFLPQERAWLDKLEASGMHDAFRLHNKAPHNYTWWSYRANARAKNLGWRIDYHFVSSPLKAHIKKCEILSDVVYSDHCPVMLEIV